MILKHHLGNDKKRSAGLNEAKIKIISPFPEKVNVSQSNMLSYKYLNTKFSPDVCTSPGLFSSQSPPSSSSSGSDWAQSHAGNFAVTSYGWSPVSIFCTFLRQNAVCPAGCFCVYFKTLLVLWRVSPAQSGSAQIFYYFAPK